MVAPLTTLVRDLTASAVLTELCHPRPALTRSSPYFEIRSRTELLSMIWPLASSETPRVTTETIVMTLTHAGLPTTGTAVQVGRRVTPGQAGTTVMTVAPAIGRKTMRTLSLWAKDGLF